MWDGLTAEERAALPIKEQVEPLLAALQTLNAEVVKAINATTFLQGVPAAQEAELDKKLKAKIDAERKAGHKVVLLQVNRGGELTFIGVRVP